MNRNRLKVAFAGGIFIAAASFIYTSATYTRKYSEVEVASDKPAAYSGIEARQQYWQQLNANVNTGLVESEDFENVLKQINSRPSKKSASSLSFIEEGPDNVGGRTRAIVVDKRNSNIIYAGSITGGLFKSTNKGGTWAPVDGFTNAVNAANINAAVMSISTMDMTEDGTLYVGTGGGLVGEGGISNGGSGSQGAKGIWVSKDNGATFTQLATTNNWDVSRITAHPTQNKIFITGVGRGVTIYNGTTFSTAAGITGDQTDVRISPDGNLVVAGRTSTFISTDGGLNFTSVTGAASSKKIESGSNARYAISHEKNANNRYNIYASLASGGSLAGIWMSPDSGTSWYEIGPGGSTTFQPFGSNNQGYYDNIITAVKGRPNECIMGGIDLWHWKLATSLSSPSGQWTSISQWFASEYSPKYVHADQHEMTWDKEGNLYFGNDGGIFTFIPPFPEDVSFISFKHLVKKYNTVQFYAMAAGPTGDMIGGTQDNGTNLNNHTRSSHQSTYEVIGGDGFDCEISQLSGDGMIGSVYYTSLVRSDDGFGNGSSVSVPCPTGTSPGDLSSPCGSFYTNFTLQELAFDSNTKDSVDYVFTEDVTVADGATYDFTYPSQNFSIELNGSYTNTTGSPVTFERNDKIRVPDYVQALFALSIPGAGVFVTRDIWKFGQSPEWWKVLGADNGFTASATSLKFSRDGQVLYVGTSGGQVWRVDGIGNAYDRRAAHLDIAFTTNPQDNKKAVIDKIDAAIIAVDQVNRTFTVSGDFVGTVTPGMQIRVTGAGTNNNIYTVSTVTANGADTDIRVTGTGNLPSATPGGLINIYYTAPFSLDFYNNTYYDVIDGSEIRFKIKRTQIFAGPGSQTVTDIAVDPNTAERVVITLGGFGAGTNIARSTTAASTTNTTSFTNIHGAGATALPLMPAYSAVIDKDNPNKIYVGTVFGLWYTENGGTTWVENNEQFGRVPVFTVRQDVSLDPNFGGAMYIATHGRGMWSTNKFLSTEENVKIDDEQKIKSAISVYPNPTTDVLNLTYELANSSDVMVNIVSLEGKLIKSVNMGSKYIGKHRTNINVQELPKGLYVLQVKTATDSKVAKFIKQ